MHIAYCDESGDPARTVLSALVVPDAAWRQAFNAIRAWRRTLHARYGIPIAHELHATDLIRGHGTPGQRSRPLGRPLGCIIFMDAINALNHLGQLGVYGVNVSLVNANYRHPLRTAALRAFQRVENNLVHVSQQQGRDEFGLVVYDGQTAQRRTMAQRILRRMQVYNPIPSRVVAGTFLAAPLRHIIGDPVLRDSADDVFIQMADIMAYALLRQDNPPSHPVSVQYGIQTAFSRLPDIWLTAASASDLQGVVRG